MKQSVILRAEKLTVSYKNGDLPVLHQLSLSIKQGECLAVIGESGSGKSTLLKALACLQSCEQGTVYYEGKALPDPLQLLVKGYEGIRYVSQDTVLPKLRTVEDMMRYELRYFGMEEQAVLMDQYLDLLALQEYRHRKDTELSGGQKQRVALALALASDASLLVLDEPFNQIDIITREQVKDRLFSHFKNSGKTLVMVTHDATDALPWADRILVLRDGKLIQSGSAKEVYEHPSDLYVASLFGAVQQLNKRQLKELLHIDWPPRCSRAGIRSEDIVYKQNAHENSIRTYWKRSYYAGRQYQWILQDETGGEWSVFASQKEPSKSVVYISFPLTHIFFFK